MEFTVEDYSYIMRAYAGANVRLILVFFLKICCGF